MRLCSYALNDNVNRLIHNINRLINCINRPINNNLMASNCKLLLIMAHYGQFMIPQDFKFTMWLEHALSRKTQIEMLKCPEIICFKHVSECLLVIFEITLQNMREPSSRIMVGDISKDSRSHKTPLLVL